MDFFFGKLHTSNEGTVENDRLVNFVRTDNAYPFSHSAYEMPKRETGGVPVVSQDNLMNDVHDPSWKAKRMTLTYTIEQPKHGFGDIRLIIHLWVYISEENVMKKAEIP